MGVLSLQTVGGIRVSNGSGGTGKPSPSWAWGVLAQTTSRTSFYCTTGVLRVWYTLLLVALMYTHILSARARSGAHGLLGIKPLLW